MNVDFFVKDIINGIHGNLVTERGSFEAIKNGLMEYIEQERYNIEIDILDERKTRVWDNAHKVGLRNMQKKIRATANECEALNYDQERILAEFRSLLRYSR